MSWLRSRLFHSSKHVTLLWMQQRLASILNKRTGRSLLQSPTSVIDFNPTDCYNRTCRPITDATTQTRHRLVRHQQGVREQMTECAQAIIWTPDAVKDVASHIGWCVAGCVLLIFIGIPLIRGMLS